MRHKASKVECTCGSKMGVISAKNADVGTWKKDSKGRWFKARRPSTCSIIVRCKKRSCPITRVFVGRSKSVAMHKIHKDVQRVRDGKISKRREVVSLDKV